MPSPPVPPNRTRRDGECLFLYLLFLKRSTNAGIAKIRT
jgi:hypothetical protein